MTKNKRKKLINSVVIILLIALSLSIFAQGLILLF